MAKITWNENGWTKIQDADAKLHLLEISCNAQDGQVKELRVRHNDGEEEILTASLGGGYSLPMDLDAFKTAFEGGQIKLK